MPLQVEVYDVSCPQVTLPTAPIEVAAVTDGGVDWQRVTILIPAGHSGLTGIALAFGHQPVIPRNAGAWISGDDVDRVYDISDFPAAGSWTIFLCNNDLQAHVWETIWEGTVTNSDTVVTSPQALPASSIYAASQPSQVGF